MSLFSILLLVSLVLSNQCGEEIKVHLKETPIFNYYRNAHLTESQCERVPGAIGAPHIIKSIRIQHRFFLLLISKGDAEGHGSTELVARPGDGARGDGCDLSDFSSGNVKMSGFILSVNGGTAFIQLSDGTRR